MNLTREQTIEEHRKMWNWIAEQTMEHQRKIEMVEYMQVYFPDTYILGHCFCCQYIYQMFKWYRNCIYCPVEWGAISCENEGSVWIKWKNTKDWEKASKYAKQIAELPERITRQVRLCDIL